uniref:NADH dehydrogenase subunit 5 n=1 Tax=Chaetocnema confinis TaxID=1896592 RepID=UPI002237EC83|nr:NADH dehydrogenase subunit 5 [Chaetocnema confinis]UYC28914.1 NADH dehydrogenase subunit 5 [Chaetocnema confinis]
MCYIYSCMFFMLSLIIMFLSLNFLILDKIYFIEFIFLTLNSSEFIYVLLLDWMSLMFMSFVFFISSMVIFYSEGYMIGDMNKNRFILLVVLFVFSMMLMIISPNLISILMGWDGLGLVSYCLVIYYQNVKSFNAGMLTALSNRIGDVALLMGIAWMLNYGSWSFMFYLELMKEDFIMKLICLLVLIASLTKSAQIPFSSWLPAAMAAPTPVSSLVHSSTLVTAGVYLLIRFNFAFSYELMKVLLFISSATMFMSGLGANFEFDLKKIIALSTLSQLGMMMSILSLGSYKLAFFHLLIHALFKALLFMCAGNIIHSMSNYQDIRFMGSLIYQFPLTSTYFNLCNWSLCGLPFMSGFYSKDLIMELSSMGLINSFIYFIFYISIGLTVAYSFRLSYYTLSGDFNFNSLNLLKENSFIMLMGMSGLILFVIFSGSMFSWLMFYYPFFICLSFIMKLMTLFLIFIGMFLGYSLAQFHISYMLYSNNMYCLFISSMWYMPILSTVGIMSQPLKGGKIYYKNFDQGWLEFYGGQKLSLNLNLVFFFQLFSKNHLKIFLLMLVIWLIMLVI